MYTQSVEHQVGEVLSIYVCAYAEFEADLRVCVGESGMIVRFPTSLYTGEIPEFPPHSVWDIHLHSGAMTAQRLMDEVEAANSGALHVEKALEVIENGTY